MGNDTSEKITKIVVSSSDAGDDVPIEWRDPSQIKQHRRAILTPSGCSLMSTRQQSGLLWSLGSMIRSKLMISPRRFFGRVSEVEAN